MCAVLGCSNEPNVQAFLAQSSILFKNDERMDRAEATHAINRKEICVEIAQEHY